jgi:hypothetical protein
MEEGFVAFGEPCPSGSEAAEGGEVGVASLDDPSPRHEADMLGLAGPPWVCRDIGGVADGRYAGAEVIGVKSAIGGERADDAGRQHEACQRLARRHEVMFVSSAQADGKDRALPLDDDRPERALARPVEPRRPPFCVADKGAGVWRPSTARNDGSMTPAASACATLAACSRSNTPAAFHSRNRRSAVAVEHSVVAFKARQGQPVRITYQIAAIARRAGTKGRPPLGCARSGGTSGSINAQSPAGNTQLSITKTPQHNKNNNAQVVRADSELVEG